MDKGNLIISTKGKEKKIAAVTQIIVLFIAFLVMMNSLKDVSRDEESSAMLFMLFWVVIFVVGVVSAVVEGKRYESYMEVYEMGLFLRTAGGYTKMPEDIQLKYTDITNISASGNILTIYTAYSQYQVYVQKAKKPEQELAVEAVRKRMGTDGSIAEEGEVVTEAAVAENKEEMKKNSWKALLFIAIWIVMVIAIVFYFH